MNTRNRRALERENSWLHEQLDQIAEDHPEWFDHENEDSRANDSCENANEDDEDEGD